MPPKSRKTKWCSYCADYHSISDFYRNATKPDGLNGICKVAQLEVNRKNKRNSKHKEPKQLSFNFNI